MDLILTDIMNINIKMSSLKPAHIWQLIFLVVKQALQVAGLHGPISTLSKIVWSFKCFSC
jgi:hypothetical protein